MPKQARRTNKPAPSIRNIAAPLYPARVAARLNPVEVIHEE
ncbi:MAG: hypothetical protein ABSH32_19335 [Bryobacteraceae bacterium]